MVGQFSVLSQPRSSRTKLLTWREYDRLQTSPNSKRTHINHSVSNKCIGRSVMLMFLGKVPVQWSQFGPSFILNYYIDTSSWLHCKVIPSDPNGVVWMKAFKKAPISFSFISLNSLLREKEGGGFTSICIINWHLHSSTIPSLMSVHCQQQYLLRTNYHVNI
jgi:hypothetical protein